MTRPLCNRTARHKTKAITSKDVRLRGKSNWASSSEGGPVGTCGGASHPKSVKRDWGKNFWPKMPHFSNMRCHFTDGKTFFTARSTTLSHSNLLISPSALDALSSRYNISNCVFRGPKQPTSAGCSHDVKPGGMNRSRRFSCLAVDGMERCMCAGARSMTKMSLRDGAAFFNILPSKRRYRLMVTCEAHALFCTQTNVPSNFGIFWRLPKNRSLHTMIWGSSGWIALSVQILASNVHRARLVARDVWSIPVLVAIDPAASSGFNNRLVSSMLMHSGLSASASAWFAHLKKATASKKNGKMPFFWTPKMGSFFWPPNWLAPLKLSFELTKSSQKKGPKNGTPKTGKNHPKKRFKRCHDKILLWQIQPWTVAPAKS